jgi:hypothetical protein
MPRPRRFSRSSVAPGTSGSGGLTRQVATPANSLLVTFELVPSGAGTVVRLTEAGFREMGWEAAVLEEYYKEHCVGWDIHLARLGEYLGQLVSTP